MITTLSGAVDSYLATLALGSAQNTVKVRETQLKAFRDFVGDIPVDEITDAHTAEFLATCRTAGNGEATIASKISALRGLFEWLAGTGKRRADLPDPMYGLKAGKAIPRNFTIVPPEDWGRLLDYAETRFSAKLRAAMALGFFHLLREGETQRLRVGFLHDDYRRLDVIVQKSNLLSKGEPVQAHLREELRKWCQTYESIIGEPLQPDYFLIPRSMPRHTGWRRGDPRRLDPSRMSGRFGEQIGEVLAACGYSPVDDEGRQTRDGSHTLRRSGACATHTELRMRGESGATRLTSIRLHHSNEKTTETYIKQAIGSKELDRYFYDDDTALPDNVVRLRPRDTEQVIGRVDEGLV